jgi:hypothetical protein
MDKKYISFVEEVRSNSSVSTIETLLTYYDSFTFTFMWIQFSFLKPQIIPSRSLSIHPFKFLNRIPLTGTFYSLMNQTRMPEMSPEMPFALMKAITFVHFSFS